MTYRPYPDADRALRQVRRHPQPPACPRCLHPVDAHATEDSQPVCTRGQGARISCRDCAETWARTPATATILDLGRALRAPIGRANATLTLTGR